MASTIPIVGSFLTWLLMPLAAALLCLAGLLAAEETSCVFPDHGVEESYIHTPTHSCLCTAGMETGSESNRSQCRLESACRRRELCHCWCVEGSQAVNETTGFPSSLLSTPMEGGATFQCRLQRAWALSALDGPSFIRGG